MMTFLLYPFSAIAQPKCLMFCWCENRSLATEPGTPPCDISNVKVEFACKIVTVCKNKCHHSLH